MYNVSVFTTVHVSKFKDMLKYVRGVRTEADRSAGWKHQGLTTGISTTLLIFRDSAF